MADETLDLGHLYDGVDLDELGGGHLYDDTEVEPRVTDDLLHRDMIVVQLMKPVETVYGSGTVPDGDASYCYCSFEPRINKNSTFSKNWAQDTTPQTTGGLREDALAIVLAPEWHGDINTQSGSITPVTRLTAHLWRCVTPRMPPTIGTSPRGASAMRPRTTG